MKDYSNRIRDYAFIIATALLWTVVTQAPAWPRQVDSQKTQIFTDKKSCLELFDLLETLITENPKTAAEISKITKVTVRRSRKDSNPFCNFSYSKDYRGPWPHKLGLDTLSPQRPETPDDTHLISGLEFSEPTERNDNHQRTAIINLSDKIDINLNDVLEHFGKEPVITPPNPELPPNTATTNYSYGLTRCRITFCMDTTEKKKLRTIWMTFE